MSGGLADAISRTVKDRPGLLLRRSVLTGPTTVQVHNGTQVQVDDWVSNPGEGGKAVLMKAPGGAVVGLGLDGEAEDQGPWPKTFAVRKTDGSTSITSTSQAAATYISGTYLNLGARPFDTVLLCTGVVRMVETVGWSAARGANMFVSIRVNGEDPWPYTKYPYGWWSAAGDSIGSTVMWQQYWALPAGQTAEFRLYAYKNSSNLSCHAESTHTQLTVVQSLA